MTLKEDKIFIYLNFQFFTVKHFPYLFLSQQVTAFENLFSFIERCPSPTSNDTSPCVPSCEMPTQGKSSSTFWEITLVWVRRNPTQNLFRSILKKM